MYDVVVVGGGVAGLTAASYLCRAGRRVILLEKEATLGGLVNSFSYKGFTFDGGIRAIENSGIVLPMLRQLGVELEFLENPVSIGIRDRVVRLDSRASLKDYQQLLEDEFPANAADIQAIMDETTRIMKHLDVLYGIDNPLFLELPQDREYFLRRVLPQLIRYPGTFRTIRDLQTPVNEYLSRLTDNPALVDLIAQHFFQQTPAFFALSYFSLYLDYQYIKGGTGRLTDGLAGYIRDHGGEIHCECEVTRVLPENHIVMDGQGTEFAYRKLVWAADHKLLYRVLDTEQLADPVVRRRVTDHQAVLSDKVGGDSVLTLYLMVNLPPEAFAERSGPHLFYTPKTQGLNSAEMKCLETRMHDARGTADEWETLRAYVIRLLELTTYEISIPVLRDDALAPPGSTGLIISVLFDHALVSRIASLGEYETFKQLAGEVMVRVLENSVFPGLTDATMERFVATPLTMERRTGNAQGAITGWAFTNQPVPAVNQLLKVSRSVRTPIPDVYQAGQWTYSPAGLPISIMTGKLAADAVHKRLPKTSG